MNLYYSDNINACNAVDDANKLTMTADKIKTALEAYLKSTSMIADTATMWKFLITVVDPTASAPASWWSTYTLPDTGVKLAQILENEAEQEGLVTEPSGSTTYTTGTSVVYQVR